mmetsp:Transcript_29045/g.74595  ORF Transcript_29045/g.74595 Transcript_29045/m.74595 type:complete len:83 (-) Transcript_29045:3604-3852(-)
MHCCYLPSHSVALAHRYICSLYLTSHIEASGSSFMHASTSATSAFSFSSSTTPNPISPVRGERKSVPSLLLMMGGRPKGGGD